MKFIYTRCDSVVLPIREGTVRARLCRVLLDGYLSDSLILRFCVFCDSIQVSKGIYWMIKLFTGFWGPPCCNLKRIMVLSQQTSTFSQVARTVIAPVERVALPHRMWRWMGRAEGASMSILSTRWAPTSAAMIYCITGVKTLLTVVVTPFATGRGLPCRKH